MLVLVTTSLQARCPRCPHACFAPLVVVVVDVDVVAVLLRRVGAAGRLLQL